MYAYRKPHSCETSLINLLEWKRARDNRLTVAFLLTDMSKPFDSLHPPLLLSKLKAYGFQEGMIQLLNRYLCDQKYQVKIGSHISSSRTISWGCPQGSALGPLMWNIFQNDLSFFVKLSLSMYADDHQMFLVRNDQSTVALDSIGHDSFGTLYKKYPLTGYRNQKLPLPGPNSKNAFSNTLRALSIQALSWASCMSPNPPQIKNKLIILKLNKNKGP